MSVTDNLVDIGWLIFTSWSFLLRHGACLPDAGTLIKIGQFLSRPEYKFDDERRTSGWYYWVKER